MVDQIRAGELTISAALDWGKSDPVVVKVKVRFLVEAVPGYGPCGPLGVLSEVKIAENHRVGVGGLELDSATRWRPS